MEEAACAVCGSGRKKQHFDKKSRTGEPFTLVCCRDCGLRYVSPRPDEDEIAAWYTADYFTRRDDRGYENYFSDEQRREFNRVTGLNLRDLGFFDFEENLAGTKRSLDIGCAAGYFVEFMKGRGWDARGIDISEDGIRFARERGLQAEYGDYLDREYNGSFDLVTLWATIEHLHRPEAFIEKIHADLAGRGRLYVSTCRAGGFSWGRLAGKGWRFYNFPEHLVFFSIGNVKKLLMDRGFSVDRVITYGSGFGRPGTVIRRAADTAAKKFMMGDMMLIGASKG